MTDPDTTDPLIKPDKMAISKGNKPSPKAPKEPLPPEVQEHLKDDLVQKASSIRSGRDVLRNRMKKIEESKGKVKENVYQKVASDYFERMEETRKDLLEIKEKIDEELSALYEKEQDAAKRIHQHEEALEEICFRHDLGEFSDKDFKEASSKEQNLLDEVSKEQKEFQGAISVYEKIFEGEELGVKEKKEKPPPAKVETPPPSPPPSVGAQEPRVSSRDEKVTQKPTAPKKEPKAPPPEVTGTLVLLENGQVTGEYPIEESLQIGRSPSNDIVLKESKVSRKHADVVKKEDGCHIIDNNSSNGTFINGTKIADHLLKPGDKIQIGSFEIEFKA